LSAGSTLKPALDLSGTFVFGLNGALTASTSSASWVLAVITAPGGGIIRDVLIAAMPWKKYWRRCARRTVRSAMRRWKRFAVCGPVPTTTSRASWPEQPAGGEGDGRLAG
jgi:hypothetical protein